MSEGAHARGPAGLPRALMAVWMVLCALPDLAWAVIAAPWFGFGCCAFGLVVPFAFALPPFALLVGARHLDTEDDAWERVRVGVIALGPVERISARNQLPGTVEELLPEDRRVLVRVDVGLPLLVEVSPSAVADLALAPGTPVWCLFKSNALEVLDAPRDPGEPLSRAGTGAGAGR